MTRRVPLALLAGLACLGGAWAQVPETPGVEAATSEAQPVPHPRVTVDFRIDGLDEPELSNAYNWLGYVAEDQRGRLDEPRLRALHEAAGRSIEKALQPYGYYAPRVTPELTGGPRDFFARYHVEPGTPVHWAAPQIALEGPGAALQDEIAALAPRLGRRLRHAEYDAYKTRALNHLREAGYLDARALRTELRIDTTRHEAVALLGFDTGARWLFGEARFEGSASIGEDVLRRYLRFEAGKPFSPQALLDTQFALDDLDYFAQVEITPLREAAEGDRIPVRIVLTDNKARRDDFGLGYGTDTGARLTAATELRRFNSRGHKLRLALRASEKISGASGEYRIPVGAVPAEYLSFSGAAERDDLAYGSSNDYRLGLAFNRTMGFWKRVYYLRFHHSLFDFDEGEDSTATVLTPGLTLSRQWLDDPAYARLGLSLSLDVHGAQQGYLSDVTFVQTRGQLKGALPLGRKARFLGRLEFGATTVRGFTDLPPDERFFAGGDQSVRGYAYQSIGAGSDDNGGLIGGRYLNVFSAEVEQRVLGNWGVALFVDGGGIGDVPNPRLEYGMGGGARYRAPFGSVQIDLAHPLKSGEPPVRLHIGVRVGL